MGDPRETLVEIKGKGLLQTYWVNPVDRALTQHSSESMGTTGTTSNASVNGTRDDYEEAASRSESIDDTLRRAVHGLVRNSPSSNTAANHALKGHPSNSDVNSPD